MNEHEEKIKRDVVDQLYWDQRVDSSDIKVSVDNNTITLSGVVSSFTEKKQAATDAWSIEGVSELNNNIKVEYPSSLKIPTDEEIKENVETSLLLNLDLDSSEIKVSVRNGIITLEGTVDSFLKKNKAEKVISDLLGVIDIVNKLTIIPTKTYTDQKIAEDILNSVDRNYRISINDINVKVEEGKVFLSGKVPDWDTYQAVLNTAEKTKGVIGVQEDIKIEQS
jgi:osmotically-inducible protein OsmY